MATFQRSSLRRCRDGSTQCCVGQSSSLRNLRKRLVLPSWLQTCGFDLFHLPPCRGPWVPSCSPFQLWLQQPPTIQLTSFKCFIHCPPIWVTAVLNVATQGSCHPCGMGEIWTQVRWYPRAVLWTPFSPAARLRVESTETSQRLRDSIGTSPTPPPSLWAPCPHSLPLQGHNGKCCLRGHDLPLFFKWL